MIEPTPGHVVWYYDNGVHSEIRQYDKPLAAIVAYVWNNRMVNLTVIDANGVSHPVTSVALLQDDDVPNEAAPYAEWMPFQKGQASKTEALEAKLA